MILVCFTINPLYSFKVKFFCFFCWMCNYNKPSHPYHYVSQSDKKSKNQFQKQKSILKDLKNITKGEYILKFRKKIIHTILFILIAYCYLIFDFIIRNLS